MRILFYYRGYESLATGFLAASLRAAGHDVGLLYDPGLDNNFHFRIRGAGRLDRTAALVEEAVRFRPDLLAFSCITSLYPYVKAIARRLRAALPDVPQLVGGPHAAALPEHVLRDGGFDYAGLGECEGMIVELAGRLEQGGDPSRIENLGFLRDGALVLNPLRPKVEDLDKLPWPERGMWERAGFDFRELMVMGSRGCWFRCDFCMNAYNLSLYGEAKSGIRRRSPENLVAEIREMRGRYGARFVFFYDDDLAADLDWLGRFAELYGRELRLPFYCHGTNNRLDAARLRLLKDAGCRQLFMGIDSGSEALRAATLNRHFTNEDAAEKARMVRAAGIDLQVSAIFGIPGETRAQMRETVEFTASIRPAVTATYVCYPFPGTPILEAARRAGVLDAEAEARMRAGEGSLHSESILRHPLGRVAYACMNLLPVYTKAPAALRPLLLSLMMRGAPGALARAVFLVAIPFTSPLFGFTRLRALATQFRRTLRLLATEKMGPVPGA